MTTAPTDPEHTLRSRWHFYRGEAMNAPTPTMRVRAGGAADALLGLFRVFGFALPSMAVDKPLTGQITAGWVIADATGKRFRAWQDGGAVWVDDPALATYYARRKDAEAVHLDDDAAWRVLPMPVPQADTAEDTCGPVPPETITALRAQGYEIVYPGGFFYAYTTQIHGEPVLNGGWHSSPDRAWRALVDLLAQAAPATAQAEGAR